MKSLSLGRKRATALGSGQRTNPLPHGRVGRVASSPMAPISKSSVPGEVKVTSKLGTSDTFKVVCEDDWNRYTWYIAPSFEMTVIYENHRKRQNSTETYETVSFTKP